jgi:hypothetical protein
MDETEGGLGRWTEISNEPPPPGIPVWLWDGMHIWIGAHDDTGEGWCFGNTYGHIWRNPKTGDWETTDNEWDDDYQPTHWMPLPEPPAA